MSEYSGLSEEALIERLYRLQPEEARVGAAEIVDLLHHPDVDVRVAAMSALFVTGKVGAHRGLALRALSRAKDETERAKAAMAISATSDADTRTEDIALLIRALRNELETSEVRRSAYEALLLLHGRDDFPDSLKDFDPAVDVDWIWIDTLNGE